MRSERPKLRTPGLLLLEPGTERYRVKGGGSTTVALSAGDEATLIDLEGRQRCELVVLGQDGKEDATALGAKADGRSEFLPSLLERDEELLRFFDRLRVETREVPVVQLFGGETRAGTEEIFKAERDVVCVVIAAGCPMRVDEQSPPTDLRVIVKRAVAARPSEIVLPFLAEPILDVRVFKATARSYEVKAGDYIQIVDVAGRQCSDFLAFDSRRLQDGVERELDGTTTRTLMGAAYPRPAAVRLSGVIDFIN